MSLLPPNLQLFEEDKDTGSAINSPGRVERQDSASSQPERRAAARSSNAAAGAALGSTDAATDAIGSSRPGAGRPSNSGGSDGSNGYVNGGLVASSGKPPRLRPRQLLRLG